MSGAEIAGLLLAGPPLIVSFLEHYREVFEMLHCWKKYRAQYRKAETQLQSLELSMDFIFESLFSPCVDNDAELERLKEDHRKGTWDGAELELSARLLPEILAVYTKLLRDFREASESLAQELFHRRHVSDRSVGDPANPSMRSRVQNRANYEWDRLCFSTRESQREAAIRKVKSLLDQIQGLLTQNDDTVRIRTQRFDGTARRNFRSAVLQFWRHAHSVYDLMFKTWSCNCQSQHYVDLILSSPTPREVIFDLRLHYDRATSAAISTPWSEQPARVTRIEWPQPQPAGQLQSRRGVRFAATEAVQTLNAIHSLCGALGAANTARSILGVLSGHGHEGGYSVSLLDRAGPSANCETVSLGELLCRDPWDRPQRRERYRIAAVIASAHLQLHSSSWLQDGWREDRILLLRNGSQASDTVCLRKGFEESKPPLEKPTFDIAFATLGIVLLELCFGCTLQSTPFWDKTNKKSDLVQDRAAAWEWAEMVEGEADERYKHAIDWCLGKWSVRSGDKMWREEFQRIVVEPLQEEAGTMT